MSAEYWIAGIIIYLLFGLWLCKIIKEMSGDYPRPGVKKW